MKSLVILFVLNKYTIELALIQNKTEFKVSDTQNLTYIKARDNRYE